MANDGDVAANVLMPGLAPVGSCIPWTGSGEPPEGEWAIADGKLIDKTTYATYMARTGHKYNGGVDPGSNKVRVPDKRGKKSVGAINMGSTLGAGANDNAHHQGAAGTSYGEVLHTDIWNESGINQNAGFGAMGNPSSDHTHSGTTAGASARHAHVYGNAIHFTYASGGVGLDVLGLGEVSRSTGADSPDHAHGFGTSGVSAWHQHSLIARNADVAHNTLDPAESDCWIVRIG